MAWKLLLSAGTTWLPSFQIKVKTDASFPPSHDDGRVRALATGALADIGSGRRRPDSNQFTPGHRRPCRQRRSRRQHLYSTTRRPRSRCSNSRPAGRGGNQLVLPQVTNGSNRAISGTYGSSSARHAATGANSAISTIGGYGSERLGLQGTPATAGPDGLRILTMMGYGVNANTFNTAAPATYGYPPGQTRSGPRGV